MYRPQDGPTSGTIKFATVSTNIGGHYNSNTGVYTCEHPGIYVFTVHLYKAPSSSVSNAQTYIKQNDANTIWTYCDSSGNSDGGYYESSNTAVLHLNRGDRVNLGSGSVASTMNYLTSFSGFLLISD